MPIKRCNNCGPHEFQDRKYGQGVRVFTDNGKGEAKVCTVCGKSSSESSIVRKAGK